MCKLPGTPRLYCIRGIINVFIGNLFCYSGKLTVVSLGTGSDVSWKP